MQSTDFGGDMATADARFEAHRIAFAPVVFQVVQVMRRTGLLRHLVGARDWLTQPELEASTGLSTYAATVLLETALAARVVERQQVGATPQPEHLKWRATAIGRLVERDPLVRVNMDFVSDVCYRSLTHLEESLRQGCPAGLQELGPWKTFYEGMAEMPEPARSSWFSYDHFYSDSAFPAALEVLAARHVEHVADVGANTGRFAVAFLQRFEHGKITLCDLPQQLVLARATLEELGLLERAVLYPCDLLDEASRLPHGDAAPDAFWMSQFVCCFTEAQIVSILARAAMAVRDGGSIFVLDTFWDDQAHSAAAYCLINTSPYFATVANGNSRMYRLDLFLSLARSAGLVELQVWHQQGWCHTLIELARAG
jgi:ubiquinone/menaquinone biosynthesis C-methylase UbiE